MYVPTTFPIYSSKPDTSSGADLCLSLRGQVHVVESAESGADKNYDADRRHRFMLCTKPPRRGVQGPPEVWGMD